MNYAMTVDNNIITVHESFGLITSKTFDENSDYAGLEVLQIKGGQEYQSNTDIRCYDKKGKGLPLVYCIEKGYVPMPDNCEIIDGELIKIDTPVEDAPVSIKQMMLEQMQKINQLIEMTKGVAEISADIVSLKRKVQAIETKDLPVIDIPVIDPPIKDIPVIDLPVIDIPIKKGVKG